MKLSVVASHHPLPLVVAVRSGSALRWGMMATCAVMLAGCASEPLRTAGGPGGGRYFDPILGVWASPRLIEDGQPVPRGGGGYLVGRPYTIGGRRFVPNANPQGYVVVGTASWYGDAFHGRRTANGEIFDKGSISAAHPTLPLPSYTRVTNLKNGRSMIVRVNDRGPYHGGRVMDVSQRVAEALAFKGEGTARIRVEYIGRASLAGSDEDRLLASLRTDGSLARLDGMAEPTQQADGGAPGLPEAPPALPGLPPVTTPPKFRRGHVVARAPEPTMPVHAFASPEPALAPSPSAWPSAAPVSTRTFRSTFPRHGGAVRDPFYRPLPAGKDPASRPIISFGTPQRRSKPSQSATQAKTGTAAGEGQP